MQREGDPLDQVPIKWICVTPTKNEAWIADHFARAAASWADCIIVADQNSSDSTVAKLQRTSAVSIVPNQSPDYDESARQSLLLSKAREIPGRRIIVALDADEALSAGARNTTDWHRIEQAAPGTVLRFRWVNVLPGFHDAWISPNLIPCGYIDDNRPHTGSKIHSCRVPWREGAPVLDLNEIVVLHFQYISPQRVTSKHRWYQVWEYLNNPSQGALKLFRTYNHMHGSWASDELHPIDEAWIAGYKDAGIDFARIEPEPVTWWDREIIGYFLTHGVDRFRRLDIWDTDWTTIARAVGYNDVKVRDPRDLRHKLTHLALRATQQHRANLIVRFFEKLLRTAGW